MRAFAFWVCFLQLVPGCAFLSAAHGMKHTRVAANSENYDALVATAKTLGWPTQRGSGNMSSLDDWDLQVFPAPDQKILFAKLVQTGKIDFNCKGGALSNADACVAAANRLLDPAFHSVYSQ